MIGVSFFKLVVHLCFIIYIFISTYAKVCDESEFVYDYTECDRNGERWRIAVPKSHSVTCDNIPPPQSGVNCSFSCPAGHFLDLQKQKCDECPPGTFSLGSGQRFEDLSKWPDGFSVENMQDSSENYYSPGSSSASIPESCSTTVGWVIESGQIRYRPSTCISTLKILLHVIHSGYIEFYYKMPKNSRGLVSHIDVRNEQCQSYSNTFASLFRKDTEDVGSSGDWQIKRLELQKGQNLITWQIANNVEMTTLADVIYIAKIDVFGIAYTSSCSKCPAGMFAAKSGQKQCTSCQKDSYSYPGATSCRLCESDEYANFKLTGCVPKPPCQRYDYYPTYSSCQNGKLNINYNRVLPSICRDSLPNSIEKPQSENNHACLKCSPGMARNSDGICKFCNPNEYSDGSGCHICPSKARPNYGFFFTNWERLPDVSDVSCEYTTFEQNRECQNNAAWVPKGDRLESGTTRDVGLALEFAVNITTGFFNPMWQKNSHDLPTTPVSVLSLDLETKCADESCTLYIVQEIIKLQNLFRFLAMFNGTTKRETYHFPLYHNGKSRIIVAFMRSQAATANDVLSDKAIIYAFNLTNVGDAATKKGAGGADSCVPCPSTNANGECQPCPPGYYIEPGANICVQCPLGKVLNQTSNLIGVQSCIYCGTNMISSDGVKCNFDGQVSLQSAGKTLKFNLYPLKDVKLAAEGIRVFAREGNSYFHSFNVSLFNEGVQCSDSSMAPGYTGTSSIEADTQFCRSTAVPIAKSNNETAEKLAYMSSFTIGRHLGVITLDRTYKGFELTDKNLEYDGMKADSRPIDVNFFFEPVKSQIKICQNGTLGVVTVRCEPTASEPQVRLSRNCPDGTCNGCLFHMIVESSNGCPICDSEDYQKIRSECVDGKQTVHFIPSKHCILVGAKSKEQIENCTSLSGLKLLLLLASVLIGLLVLVVIIFYQRNKSLEHRYHRIIEGREPDEVRTCGLDSDDEDDEEDASNTRVYFGKTKSDYVVGISKSKKTKEEKTQNNDTSLLTEYSLSNESD